MTRYHMHGGPFAGMWLDEVPPAARLNGEWDLNYTRDERRWYGRYVRDENSDRGQDWDWED